MSPYNVLVERVGEMRIERGMSAMELGPATPLTSLGFDSLDFATLIVLLETETGIDPFSTGLVREFPRDLKSLAVLYE